MYVCVYVYVYVGSVNMSAGVLGRRAGLGSSRVRVTGSCELLSVGTGNQTQLLSKSNMCS